MDVIFRRSSFFYVTTTFTYMALLGRFLLTRSAPVFEIIPLFLPVWLLSALFASEQDERYAFLRTLPIPDAEVVRIKFRLILSAVTLQWALILAAATVRLGDGRADGVTFVYVTMVCAAGLLLVAGYQIAIWRFGFPTMAVVIGVSAGVGLAVVLLHLVGLKANGDWPALSRLTVLGWLGSVPWLSVPVIAALALAAFSRLSLLGVRIKASSEAHL
jgi:hypothetical protein